MKDRLIFDTTNATTIADTDSVGAYLRASDGTLLTHTDVSGKKALDVRVAEGINVEVDLLYTDDSVTAHQGGTWTIDSITNAVTVQATNLDIRDLVFATDKVDVSGSEVSLDSATLAALESITVQNGAGAAAVNIQDGGNSITVDASDLDIRDLAFATDKVDVSGSSVTVSATNLDIRDLTHASDSVKIGDGTDFLAINADGSINVSSSDSALANTAIATAAETLDVAGTSQDIIVSPLSNRKYLFIYNDDNQRMFIGASGVTSATGFPIAPSSYMELRAGTAVDIEFVSTKINHAIRTMELS